MYMYLFLCLTCSSSSGSTTRSRSIRNLKPSEDSSQQRTNTKVYPDYSKTGFTGWIDPDTEEDVKTTISYVTGDVMKLVMSDEFDRDGRSFHDGADPMWTSMDKNDEDRGSGTMALEFYNSTNIWTENGHLVIRTNSEKTTWVGLDPYLSTATTKKIETFQRNFRSGMMQSWNKFCFTGGVFEVRLKLPGTSTNGGLWPAVWLLGLSYSTPFHCCDDFCHRNYVLLHR